MKEYCINLDWFEVFTYEPDDCYGAEFYEQLGFTVARRDYGTRVYKEMFTLIDKSGHPWLEVRRNPASKKSQGGILDDKACSLRLVNRALYDWQPISELYNFLSSLGFHYKKYELCSISRVDICVDFHEDAIMIDGEQLECAEFIRRYMSGEWWKIGPAKCQAFGEEFKTGMRYHALKFGSPSSMVNVKLYNKTLEMAQQKIKPYIIENWVKCGLLRDDMDTTPIWRLEFSISGNADEWIAESVDVAAESYYQQNTLSAYVCTANYSRFLRGLCSHYFTFAKKTEGIGKYRSERFQPLSIPADASYRPVHLQPEKQTSGRAEKMLVNKLVKIRESGVVPPQYRQALDVSLWLLQTVYCNRATTRSMEEDAEALTRTIEGYNESLIRGAFESIIFDSGLCKDVKEVAELCWGLFNSEFMQYARASVVHTPYSITAVRFLNDTKLSTEEKIRLRHLKELIEYRRKQTEREY